MNRREEKKGELPIDELINETNPHLPDEDGLLSKPTSSQQRDEGIYLQNEQVTENLTFPPKFLQLE